MNAVPSYNIAPGEDCDMVHNVLSDMNSMSGKCKVCAFACVCVTFCLSFPLSMNNRDASTVVYCEHEMLSIAMNM